MLNKIDQISVEELNLIYRIAHCVPISAHHRWNFDDLLEKMWDYLQLVRMYEPLPVFLFVTLGYVNIVLSLATVSLNTIHRTATHGIK